MRQYLSNGASIDDDRHGPAPSAWRRRRRRPPATAICWDGRQRRRHWHAAPRARQLADAVARRTPANYNGFIEDGTATGAKKLSLPLTATGVGGTNVDLVRRPAPVGEDVATAILYNERLFTKASMRILLSDTAADITNLPGVTARRPCQPRKRTGTTREHRRPATARSGATRPPIALSTGARDATVADRGESRRPSAGAGPSTFCKPALRPPFNTAVHVWRARTPSSAARRTTDARSPAARGSPDDAGPSLAQPVCDGRRQRRLIRRERCPRRWRRDASDHHHASREHRGVRAPRCLSGTSWVATSRCS